MKKILILLTSALLIFGSCGKRSSVKLANEKDTVSYFIGIMEARNLKEGLAGANFENVKPEIIARAFEEVLSGDSIKFNDMQMRTKIQSYITNLQAKIGEKNLKEGQEFLEKNKKNPAVVTLSDGLQYQVLKEGTGPKPDSSSMASIHYTGSLINGEKFQSTVGQEPYKAPVVGGFIKGMTEALLQMKVGSKWKLFIPTNLAYGQNVRPGGKIKPNMVLIFEVELLSIEPKAKEQPNPPQPRPQVMKK